MITICEGACDKGVCLIFMDVLFAVFSKLNFRSIDSPLGTRDRKAKRLKNTSVSYILQYRLEVRVLLR